MPVALQSEQGCFIIKPTPWHLEHSKCITIELLRYIVDPDPPHARQRVGAVPGWQRFPLQVPQVPFLSKSNLIFAPFTASSKVILIYLFISSPLFLREEPAE